MGISAMGVMKKGLFGCHLKHQVTAIALTYSALSVVLITYGFLLSLHPGRFSREADNYLDLARERRGSPFENRTDYIDGDVNNLDEDIFTVSPGTQLGRHDDLDHDRALENIKDQGIEIIVAGFLKLTCSVLLFHGVRSNTPWLLLPWLVEETVEMVGGFIILIIKIFKSFQWDVGMTVVGFLFYLVGSYFLFSVWSLYIAIKRKNRNADIIVQSVSQVSGGFQTGMNYQRLEEECWQSEPNLASEFRSAKDMSGGFIREKKVNLEDENDEHVLYVQ